MYFPYDDMWALHVCDPEYRTLDRVNLKTIVSVAVLQICTCCCMYEHSSTLYLPLSVCFNLLVVQKCCLLAHRADRALGQEFNTP